MADPHPHAAPARLRSLPSWLLTQSSLPAHRLVADRLAAVGARGYHYRLLATLTEFGPESQANLGRRTGIHLSDIVAAVNELAEAGFVDRSPDPADRRRNVITVTATGRTRLDELETVLGQVQEELLAPLNDQEREQLVSLLAKVLDHHGRL
ncbi:MarR family winged helix-turn-helix transcriptional regulator [Saccharomonospora sp. NPDC006951]